MGTATVASSGHSCPREAKLRFAPKSPERHPPRFRGIWPCSRISCGRAGVELRVDFSSAGRSMLPSCIAASGCHKPRGSCQWRQSRIRRCANIAGSIGEATWKRGRGAVSAGWAGPRRITVSAGVKTKSFTIKTAPVVATQIGTVSATLGATTLIENLTVRRMGMLSVTLVPTTVCSRW